jgi:hypothetical protein
VKSVLIAATLLFIASGKLQATEALIFDEGGYNLYILIGDGDRGPAVAQVRFTPPEAKEWISVPRDQIKIEKFDMKAQVLVMRFSNSKKDPELPPSFSFSAKKKKAVLTIKGKTIKSSFDWLDQ